MSAAGFVTPTRRNVHPNQVLDLYYPALAAPPVPESSAWPPPASAFVPAADPPPTGVAWGVREPPEWRTRPQRPLAVTAADPWAPPVPSTVQPPWVGPPPPHRLPPVAPLAPIAAAESVAYLTLAQELSSQAVAPRHTSFPGSSPPIVTLAPPGATQFSPARPSGPPLLPPTSLTAPLPAPATKRGLLPPSGSTLPPPPAFSSHDDDDDDEGQAEADDAAAAEPAPEPSLSPGSFVTAAVELPASATSGETQQGKRPGHPPLPQKIRITAITWNLGMAKGALGVLASGLLSASASTAEAAAAAAAAGERLSVAPLASGLRAPQGAAPSTPAAIAAWAAGERRGIAARDIVIVGVQESPLAGGGLIAWEGGLLASLGPDFVRVDGSRLDPGGVIHLAVFARRALASHVGDVAVAAVPAGWANLYGNKGAAAVSFTLGATRVLAVCSHFAAHQHKVGARNRDYRRVASALMPPRGGSSLGPLDRTRSGAVVVASPHPMNDGVNGVMTSTRGDAAATVVKGPITEADARSPPIAVIRPPPTLVSVEPMLRAPPGSVPPPPPPPAPLPPVTAPPPVAQVTAPPPPAPAFIPPVAAIRPSTTGPLSPAWQATQLASSPPPTRPLSPPPSLIAPPAVGATPFPVLSLALPPPLPPSLSPSLPPSLPPPLSRSLPAPEASPPPPAPLSQSVPLPTPTGEVVRGLAGSAYDAVIWVGDFNYRLDGSREAIDAAIEAGDWEGLESMDQLGRERAAGNIFPGFQEGHLHFPPTYRFDIGSDVYDTSAKRRTPAWTDRVLFATQPAGGAALRLLSYTSLPAVRASDHKPVVACLEMRLPQRPARVGVESMREHGTAPGDGHGRGCFIQ